MQSIMVMSTKGDNMGRFKKIWHWLFDKKKKLTSGKSIKQESLKRLML